MRNDDDRMMKPSADPLVLKCNPQVGDRHPEATQLHAINVRLMESADIEGKIEYVGPQRGRLVEVFVLSGWQGRSGEMLADGMDAL
jgi:hypothetical protein